ncbi:hypothetical protein OG765_16125 [Streptomyces sp. NBC_00555]|uniref:hypothetical protein n=1 Tax=Streptomyces sp. NBC_00555 TaxID=2903662 RepID=UPI00225BFD9F|nr:hypothetical protein [Streptomyces sp. NBC_00555]MCX5012516.1 hypothetical protein [Streptomyces sp. NBC_00555]
MNANAAPASSLPPSVPDGIEIPGGSSTSGSTCGGNLTKDGHWDANVVVFAHLTGKR